MLKPSLSSFFRSLFVLVGLVVDLVGVICDSARLHCHLLLSNRLCVLYSSVSLVLEILWSGFTVLFGLVAGPVGLR